jgi:hypothetical protein
MSITIDTKVAIPPARRGRPKGKCQYPFAGMKTGDSFFVPGPQGTVWKVRTAASEWAYNNGAKFTTRAVVEDLTPGIRVWRVA